MNKEKLLKIINQFKNKTILVIGDIMLDKYVIGSVARISPEAPVQILEAKEEKFVPGGAANVANNIVSLNANAVMIGIVGEDISKNILIKELKERKINTEGVFSDKKRPTIKKVRILGHNQQLLRVDYEDKEYISKDIEAKIINFVLEKIEDIDAIIISDYAKGVITENLMKEITSIAKKNDTTLIVDPKPKHKLFYKGASLITPNHKEACEMTNIEEDNSGTINQVGKSLLKEMDCSLLITRGEGGMSLFEKKAPVINIPTKAKEVYDVSGAGDTVVSTLTLALSSGASLEEAAVIANHAAGIVVGKVGTSIASVNEIKKSLEEDE